MLIHAPTRAAALDLVARHTGQEPVARVLEWLRALIRVDGPNTVRLLELELEVEPPRPEVPLDALLHAILTAMIGGARGPGLLAALVAEFPARGLERFAGSLGALEATLRAGGLRPLLGE